MSRVRDLLALNLVALAGVAVLLHAADTSAAHRKRGARPAHRNPGKHASRKASRHHGARVAGTVRGSRGSVDEHVHLRRGDTLGSILAARGVSDTEASPWLTAAADAYDLRSLKPHRGLTLRFDRATRALESISYEIDDHALLVLEDAGGGITARREALPYFIEVKGIAGRIDRGLRADALDAGVPERIVADLADIFGWEVDVETGLRAGDQFRVLYENVWQAGLARPGTGNVLGAELVSGGKAVTAVYFEDDDGRGAYYRPTGDPLSRQFLRYPVEFNEITSEFSLLRRHPILHVSRAHLGVDFAAPRGTPVRAVAAGVVRFAGRIQQLGRSVRIEHPGALTSVYGHLAEIPSGIRVDGHVERGQVIGYVGSSGLATGPHLHYALERDGEYVDPMALSSTGEQPIASESRRVFERVRTEVVRQLAGLPVNARATTVSLSSTAYPSAAYRSE